MMLLKNLTIWVY